MAVFPVLINCTNNVNKCVVFESTDPVHFNIRDVHTYRKANYQLSSTLGYSKRITLAISKGEEPFSRDFNGTYKTSSLC